MLVGSIGALYQKKLKRLMAYSGIANVGYMLAGIGAGTVESVHGFIFLRFSGFLWAIGGPTNAAAMILPSLFQSPGVWDGFNYGNWI